MNLSERYKNKLSQAFKTQELDMNNVLLQLEVTNACNHRCYFCPNKDSIRPKKMMDVAFAKKIIQECAEFLGSGKKICFHMNGEPLLYKELPELVAFSKDAGYEYVFLTTNGSLATDERLQALFDAGLDSIKFSINAGTKETYQRIHGKDDFNKAMGALEFSYKYRAKTHKPYKIFVSCVATKENCMELEEFYHRAEKWCDEVVFYYPCGYAGQNNDLAKMLRCDLSKYNIPSFEITHALPCPVLWNSINVTCEGFLSLCCSESDNRLIVEDLHTKSVKEAWTGKKMQAIRAIHLNSNIARGGGVQKTPCFSCVTETDYKEEDMDKQLFALSLQQRAQDRMKQCSKNH